MPGVEKGENWHWIMHIPFVVYSSPDFGQPMVEDHAFVGCGEVARGTLEKAVPRILNLEVFL